MLTPLSAYSHDGFHRAVEPQDLAPASQDRRLPQRRFKIRYDGVVAPSTLDAEFESVTYYGGDWPWSARAKHTENDQMVTHVETPDGRLMEVRKHTVESLSGYSQGKRKTWDAAWAATRERERFVAFRKRINLLERQYDRRQAELRLAFAEREEERLTRVSANLNLVYSWVVRTLSDKERKDAAIKRLKKALVRRSFVLKPFTPPPYQPRYYDFVTQTLGRQEEAAVPTAHSTVGPLPVDHRKMVNSLSHASFVLSRRTGFDSPWSFFRETARSSLKWDIGIGLEGASSPSLHDAADLFEVPCHKPFSYDKEKLAQAVSSMVPEINVEVNLPVVLMELSDVRAVWNQLKRTPIIWREARKYGRALQLELNRQYTIDRFTDLAKSLCGADLARKFGAEPTIRDGLKLTLTYLKGMSRAYQEARQLLDRQGTIRSYNRLFDETVDVTRKEIPIQDLWPDLTTWPVEFPEGGFTEDLPVNPYFEPSFHLGGWNAIKVPVVVGTRAQYRVTSLMSYVLTNQLGWPLELSDVAHGVLLDRLGLFVNPAALWEAIPFSFVVDWIVAVQSNLETFALKWVKPKVSWNAVMVSKKVYKRVDLREFRKTLAYSDPGDPEWLSDSYSEVAEIGLSAAKHTSKSYQRMLVDPDEIGIPNPGWLRSPSWWQAWTGIQLLLTGAKTSK